MYNKLIRWWLLGILLFLPFQQKITESVTLWSYATPELIKYFKYLDEITIVVLLPLSIVKLIKEKRSSLQLYIILILSILCVCIAGVISGFINGNAMKVTALGIFDYIKNFLAIFIFAAFYNYIADLKKTFKLLLIVAIFLASIAVFQEIWAVISHYLLQKDILDKSIYIFAENFMPEDSWRFGIYRAPSLMYNANILSIYLIFIIVIYTNINKKLNPAVMLILILAILFTVSRIAYIGLLAFAILQLFKKRRWILVLSMPIAVLLMIAHLFYYTSDIELKNVWKPDLPEIGSDNDTNIATTSNDVQYISFRQYAKDKGVEIWADRPFWGIGPGMYGGIISIKAASHIYDEYFFIAKKNAENWGGIDQFWAQIFAELGLIGTGLFIILLIIIVIILHMVKDHASSIDMKDFLSGLVICMTITIIYSVANGINFSAMLFIYTGFIGMGLGSLNKTITNIS